MVVNNMLMYTASILEKGKQKGLEASMKTDQKSFRNKKYLI